MKIVPNTRKLSEPTKAELSKYEKELEEHFTIQSDKVDNALLVGKLLRHSFINVYGEQNKAISICDVDNALYLINELLEPVAIELSELRLNPDYLYWDNKTLLEAKK